MATVWPEHQFALTLDQSLLIAMNDEGHVDDKEQPH